MIRKLAFAVAVLNLAFASMVHALGLGEAEVKSSLNQPLRAEIELVSVKGLQENEILPGLATREEFLKAGVDRVYFLSDLRFTVEKNAAGNLVVILTSAKPVREPFLNFLVEVIWPSGRLLREYALLIDPPLFAEEPAAPVAAPSVTRAPEPRADRVAIPAPAPVRQTESAPAANTYGPTESNDTLWDIATKVRPNRSVSPQQVMLAIQDLNPQAFIGNNINKLKAGQVLRLPTLDQIQSRSEAGAINEVIAQNRALRPTKKKAPVSAASQQPVQQGSTARQGGDELKLLVASDEGGTGSSANSGNEAQAGSGAGVDADIAITLEKLDKANLENEELSGRVDDLEEQLATLQRLLALKNDQLAGLQAQARAEEEARLAAEMTQDSQDGALSAEADPVASESEADKAMEGSEVAVSDGEIRDEEVMDEEVVETEAAAPEKDVAAEQAKEQVAEAPAEKTQESAPGRESNLFDLILNNPLYQAAAGAGLLVLLLILWLISNKNAKREQEAHAQATEYTEDEAPAFEEEYDESREQDADVAEDEFEETLDEEREEDAVAVSASDSEEKNAETEDVIAEADVYIAYGRLDQAATVLEQGISADPVRADYRLKLLEVYAETGDNEAFDRQLSELEAIQDPDAMERALEIKASMSPVAEPTQDDALELGDTHFDQNVSDALEPEAGTLAGEDAGHLVDELEDSAPDNSFDFESVEDEDEDEDLGIDLASEDLELDLDIELEGDAGVQAEEERAEGESTDGDSAEPESIEYEPASETVSDDSEVQESENDETLDAVLEEEAEAEIETEQGIDASTLELDEDIDAALDAIDVPEEADPESELEDAALDLELGDLELSEELEQESEIALPEDLSLPDEVLDLDQDTVTDEAPAESVESALEPEEEAVVSDDILDEATEALADSDELDADLGDDEDFDFLNGTDEASTKLDLARAYIDMGDVDGAKDILQEVEKEGSAEQQSEARDLIESLNK